MAEKADGGDGSRSFNSKNFQTIAEAAKYGLTVAEKAKIAMMTESELMANYGAFITNVQSQIGRSHINADDWSGEERAALYHYYELHYSPEAVAARAKASAPIVKQVTEFIPRMNDAYRVVTGKEPFTGEKANRMEAAGWFLLDVLSMGSSKAGKAAGVLSKGHKLLKNSQVVRKGSQVLEAGHPMLSQGLIIFSICQRHLSKDLLLLMVLC